jgi:GDP-L-fucose synthase
MIQSKVFVTGGSGFLGRTLVPLLKTRGYQVDAPSSRECDLTTPTTLTAFVASYDLIFHLAAWTQAGDFCLKHPGEQWIINQQINTHFLHWWQTKQPQAKAILMGTSCAYDPNLPLIEENYLRGEPIPSLYTYAMTKRMLWVGAESLKKQYGLKSMTLVPSTLCGNYYHKDGRQMHFIYDLAQKILQAKKTGKPAILWGDGYQRREVVAVEDFCGGILEILRHESAWGEVINLGAGKDHSIREFASEFCDILKINPDLIHYDENQYVGAENKLLSVSKARRWISWKPADMTACVKMVLAAVS